jgi:hypothetical protein
MTSDFIPAQEHWPTSESLDAGPATVFLSSLMQASATRLFVADSSGASRTDDERVKVRDVHRPRDPQHWFHQMSCVDTARCIST